ncbi:MAG: RdgB/HAM1 family non-canonical purine NTP pyrophosphatase [Chloroflexi bacterium]|nr:RdgB/HAM1 family non-canonical purine NTP pyrophosphatase [Chloroflexota bacterium]
MPFTTDEDKPANKQTLLIATNNQDKVVEYRQALEGMPFELTWPAKEGLQGDPEETGATYEANALLKARFFAPLAPTFWIIADDAGLEVDALGGAPGVYSKRYAGPEATDADRNRLLLAKLEGVPWERRTARFVCVIALVRPGGAESTFTGVCNGYIAFEPKGGDFGFGYDPVFYFPAMDRTFGELPLEVKNRLSHRGLAVAKLAAALRQE